MAKLREKEERKQLQKQYRETTKQLIKICTEKMPDTKYDRFYFEELVKKYPKLEDLQAFLEKIQQIPATTTEEFVKEFQFIVESSESKAQEQKQEQLAKKKEEEQ